MKGKYRIEIDSGNSVNLEGMVSIEEYTDTNITLVLNGRRCAVTGKNLILPALYNNILKISGIIQSVTLLPPREEK